jgi:Mn-dependent DtxR family transcriptional regulator
MSNVAHINGKTVDLETGEITDKTTGKTKNAIKNANKKARMRDIEVEKQKEKEQIEAAANGISQEDLKDAVNTLSQATGSDLFVGTKRKRFDKTPFSQIIHPNIDYLNKIKYLTDAECGFLLRIAPMLEFGSNCLIIKDDFDDDGMERTATPSSIARALGKERSNVSKMMSKLKSKGILANGETGIWVSSVDQDGNEKHRIVSSHTWFMNPNIICCADREKIEKGTQRIFKEALKNFLAPKDPKTKHNLPIRFFGYEKPKKP